MYENIKLLCFWLRKHSNFINPKTLTDTYKCICEKKMKGLNYYYFKKPFGKNTFFKKPKDAFWWESWEPLCDGNDESLTCIWSVAMDSWGCLSLTVILRHKQGREYSFCCNNEETGWKESNWPKVPRQVQENTQLDCTLGAFCRTLTALGFFQDN